MPIRAPQSLRRVALVGALIGLLATAACTSNPTWHDPGQQTGTPAASGEAAAPGTGPAITSPTDGATDVGVSPAVAYTAPDGTTTTVTFVAADGTTVDATPGYDPSTAVPVKALAYDAKYTAKITSTSTDGKTSSSSVSFTTMTQPGKLNTVHSFLGNAMTYGDAMPIIIQFSQPVSSANRADVQKRLAVTSTPEQPGAWNWISSKEVHFRPKELWQPGTQITINTTTAGVETGNGYYAKNDLVVNAKITEHPMSIIDDDATHIMTVSVDGKVVKRMPTSLGKPSTPSSSGQLVIMTRHPQQLFDSSLGTGGVPVDAPGGYKELVYWVMQLTWDGQFIHAAPWSVPSQGKRDVSHGCTNVSTANAKWLYENSLVGTPVNVEHTKAKVAWGDGWTDWNVDWTTFIKGSALPVT